MCLFVFSLGMYCHVPLLRGYIRQAMQQTETVVGESGPQLQLDRIRGVPDDSRATTTTTTTTTAATAATTATTATAATVATATARPYPGTSLSPSLNFGAGRETSPTSDWTPQQALALVPSLQPPLGTPT